MCVSVCVCVSHTQGVKVYSVGQRFGCIIVKFLEYSLAGISCGLVGQGVCNGLMNLK